MLKSVHYQVGMRFEGDNPLSSVSKCIDQFNDFVHKAQAIDDMFNQQIKNAVEAFDDVMKLVDQQEASSQKAFAMINREIGPEDDGLSKQRVKKAEEESREVLAKFRHKFAAEVQKHHQHGGLSEKTIRNLRNHKELNIMPGGWYNPKLSYKTVVDIENDSHRSDWSHLFSLRGKALDDPENAKYFSQDKAKTNPDPKCPIKFDGDDPLQWPSFKAWLNTYVIHDVSITWQRKCYIAIGAMQGPLKEQYELYEGGRDLFIQLLQRWEDDFAVDMGTIDNLARRLENFEPMDIDKTCSFTPYIAHIGKLNQLLLSNKTSLVGNPHIEPIIVRRCRMTYDTRFVYESDLKHSGVAGENIRHLLTFMEYYQVRSRQLETRDELRSYQQPDAEEEEAIALTTDVSKSPCLGCKKTDHRAVDCRVLLKSSPDEIAQFQVMHRLCIKCARGKHKPKDCKKQVICRKCSNTDHTAIFCGLVKKTREVQALLTLVDESEEDAVQSEE